MIARIFKRAALAFHTLRHSKPRQLLVRPLGSVKRIFLPSYVSPPADLRGALEPQTSFLHHDPWNNREQIKRGVFCFLNRAEDLGQPVDWYGARLPALWRYNLHYFNYLHLLNREEQAALCLDWAHMNAGALTATLIPTRRPYPAWHPYPTSLRIVNWCKAGFDKSDDSDTSGAWELLASLYNQAVYLYRNLESHHPGNHLLENARALIFAGRFFSGQGEADKWLERGLAIFRRQTPIQVLSDGGYFERSTMYHALMLEAYLDVINILPEGQAEKSLLVDAARRMSDFLLSVTHPDGNLALFNDSTQEIAPPTAMLLDYARRLTGREPRKQDSFAETGYFIHDGGRMYLVIDGGPLAPDFLPSHAHGDIFSYELSVGGSQFIVDAGVFEYAAGDMRRYVRGTRAHNTVCVDGQDQAEFWGSFRVARRYPPDDVHFVKTGSRSHFQGSFGGYAKLIGDRIRHRRAISCDDEKGEIAVEDVIEGAGRHLVESCIHLHPEVELTLEEGRAVLRRGGVRCAVEALNGGSFAVEDSWYCPRFGVKRQNKLLILGGALDLPARLTYRVICL